MDSKTYFLRAHHIWNLIDGYSNGYSNLEDGLRSFGNKKYYSEIILLLLIFSKKFSLNNYPTNFPSCQIPLSLNSNLAGSFVSGGA